MSREPDLVELHQDLRRAVEALHNASLFDKADHVEGVLHRADLLLGELIRRVEALESDKKAAES